MAAKRYPVMQAFLEELGLSESEASEILIKTDDDIFSGAYDVEDVLRNAMYVVDDKIKYSTKSKNNELKAKYEEIKAEIRNMLPREKTIENNKLMIETYKTYIRLLEDENKQLERSGGKQP